MPCDFCGKEEIVVTVESACNQRSIRIPTQTDVNSAGVPSIPLNACEDCKHKIELAVQKCKDETELITVNIYSNMVRELYNNTLVSPEPPPDPEPEPEPEPEPPVIWP